MFGISAALATPLLPDLSIDCDLLARHARDRLESDCDSVTLFGTTGEGASIDAGTRLAAISGLVADGAPPERLLLCLHGASVAEVRAQVARARDVGVTRFLLPPPAFFGAVQPEGLYDWFDAVLRDAGEARFLLYHIPQVIGVGLPVDVVGRLARTHPRAVAGVKDSSGDLQTARAFLKLAGLEILVGDERLLARAASLGAAGSISGLANFAAGRLRRILVARREDGGVNDLVAAILRHPVVPAVKAALAEATGEPAWRRTLPPLRPLRTGEAHDVAAAFRAFRES